MTRTAAPRIRTAILTTLALVAGLLAAGPLAPAVAAGTGSIVGTVTGSDAPSVGLAGVEITVYGAGYNYVKSAFTDSNGHFTIPADTPTSYRLLFSHPAGSNYRDYWSGNGAFFYYAALVPVADGETVQYDVTLQAKSTVSGTVTGSDDPGVGLEGVVVTAKDSLNATLGEATTDANGDYTITDLIAGATTFVFTAGGYTTEFWNNRGRLATADFYPVVGGTNVDDIDAELDLPAAISGTLSVDNGDEVALSAGQITVRYADSNPFGEAGSQYSAIYTEDGSWAFSGLPAGAYTLQFEADGYSSKTTDVTLGADENSTANAVTLEAPAPLVGGTITALVGSSQVPQEGVEAVLFYGAGNPHGEQDDIVSRVYSDENGDYAWQNVAPGTYYAGFFSDTTVPEYWLNTESAQTATRFTVLSATSRSDIDPELALSGSISGTVITDVPDSVLMVSLYRSGTAADNSESYVATGLTAGGQYVFDGLPSGSYVVGYTTFSSMLTPDGSLPAAGNGYTAQWYAGQPSYASANVVTIAPGDDLVLDDVTMHNPQFADVDPQATFYTEIQWMHANNLATGTPQSSGLPLYRPTDAVSRQAMAAFLYRFAGADFIAPETPSFADVPTDSPFYTAIEWMASEGITTGTPQSSGLPLFKPADPVSRSAAAIFLYRYTGQSTSTAPTQQSFADVPVDSAPAAAIAWMSDSGISTGTPQSSGLPLFKPSSPVSRQAIAAFLYRMP